MQPLETLTAWRGTLKEALEQATALIQADGLSLTLPPERTVRDWRTEGVLSRAGRHFTGRNVLELLRAKQLRDQDLSVTLIREYLEGQGDSELLQELRGVPRERTADLVAEVGAEWAGADIKNTVVLLASAVLKQFKLVEGGALVGIYQDLPLELRQAQAHLARLAMLSKEDDRFASVHELLERCTRPMGEWAPRPISQHPDYADMVLIDPELFVPSDDCAALAEDAGHLEDLIEVGLHRTLMEALDRLDPDRRAEAYTLIRGFIAEFPLATFEELHRLKRNPRIQGEVALIHFLDQVYLPAHVHDAVRAQVPRCGHCQGPLRGGRCRLAGCRALFPVTQVAPAVPLENAFIARPALLRYWCDPAQEELRIYRALVAVHPQATSLYPQADACDVGLGPDIGIDVKDHRDPVRLARRLNEGIGRLSLYRRKILAIATRRVRDESYLTRLNEQLSPRLRRQLEVLSVEDTIELLRNTEIHHD